MGCIYNNQLKINDGTTCRFNLLVSYNVIQEIQEACSREAGVQSHKIGDKAFNSKQNHLTGSECNGPHLSIFSTFLMCHLFIIIQLIPDEKNSNIEFEWIHSGLFVLISTYCMLEI
jgi:hypothetical protein